jgi:hexosaminidase
MLDSSRHFLSKKVILDQLDLMEINKINVFHWHLTDDTSFPFVSTTFPNMSIFGAYDPVTHVYTPDDVREIIEAARLRGIRVIPEFDTPGHTKSWELGRPGLLTACEDINGTRTGIYGPLDPTVKSTFDFLADFFEEITRTFPDKFLHIGGDEVELTSCW